MAEPIRSSNINVFTGLNMDSRLRGNDEMVLHRTPIRDPRLPASDKNAIFVRHREAAMTVRKTVEVDVSPRGKELLKSGSFEF